MPVPLFFICLGKGSMCAAKEMRSFDWRSFGDVWNQKAKRGLAMEMRSKTMIRTAWRRKCEAK